MSKPPPTYSERYGSKKVPFLTRTLCLGDDSASYETIAATMGISTARVGQLEANGLERLRRCFQLIEDGLAVDAAVELCKGRNGRPRKVAT